MKYLITLIISALTFPTVSFATTINVPGDYNTIQEGLNAATEGDTILVASGTYVENINYNGKNLVLGSWFLTTGDTSYISQTVIDGNQSGSVVKFESGEDSTAVLVGFKIVNGNSLSGGGISCSFSSPMLVGLIISENLAQEGGGISCIYSSPIISNTMISSNQASNSGGGILCSSSNANLSFVIISGNTAEYWGGGIASISSDVQIENVTITGNSASYGGGMSSRFDSNPSLVGVSITDNSSSDYGGGVSCEDSNLNLSEMTITGNSTEARGGGIYCSSCSADLVSVVITANSASYEGGGIWCSSTTLGLQGIVLSSNGAQIDGGGLYFQNSSASLDQVSIVDNSTGYRGGGIFCLYSSPILMGVRISGNSAGLLGGGIASFVNTPVFSAEDRCDLFLNNVSNRGSGADIYSDTLIEVIVDTFTVTNPTDYHASPLENFSFNILNAVQGQVQADLYVSPDGDNANDGLGPDAPLQTIQHAMSIIVVDSTNPHTIYLANGVYSPSTNGEFFPVNVVDFVSIAGESEDGVILDAEDVAPVMQFVDAGHSVVSNATLTGGRGLLAGGVYCFNSSPSLYQVTIRGNVAIYDGGGIACKYSNPTLVHVTITGNLAPYNGGGIWCYSSIPHLLSVTITENTASYYGGAIYCYNSSAPFLLNTIFWNNAPEEIYFDPSGNSNEVTIAYSDVQGGSGGIAYNDNGPVFWVEGNIDADPLFVDPENGDFNLQEGSPCIDAGTALFVWEGDTLVDLNPDEYQGNASDMGAFESTYTASVGDQSLLPTEFALHQNYPNPFNPVTTFQYDLPEATYVQLVIYDILGREIRTLVDQSEEAGYRSVIWDGTNDQRKQVGAGVYLYLVQAGEYTKVRKMVLLK